MAQALRFDGVNDYAALASTVNETDSQWRLEWRLKIVDATSISNRFIAKLSGSTDYIRTRVTSTEENIVIEFDNVVYEITGGSKVTDDGDFHDFKLIATGSQFEYYVDENFIGTTPSTETFRNMEVIGRGGSSFFEGDVSYIRYYNQTSGGTPVYNWSADDSARGAGTPILEDVAGGNDATGINMPTDGSAWINLGGGGGFQAAWAIHANQLIW